MLNILCSVEKYVWRTNYHTSGWIKIEKQFTHYGPKKLHCEGTRCSTLKNNRQMSTTLHSVSRLSIHCIDGSYFGSKTSTIGATNAYD